jgi:hypothetical protein
MKRVTRDVSGGRSGPRRLASTRPRFRTNPFPSTSMSLKDRITEGHEGGDARQGKASASAPSA